MWELFRVVEKGYSCIPWWETYPAETALFALKYPLKKNWDYKVFVLWHLTDMRVLVNVLTNLYMEQPQNDVFFITKFG
jgi:hypothetical protein